MCEGLLLEKVDVGRQRSSSTSGLQSLVRWKESPPTGVQGAEERIQSGFEQITDFKCVR